MIAPTMETHHLLLTPARLKVITMATEQKVTRKLRAILSADVKGYSILMADDEVATIETLKKYRNIISNYVDIYGGRVVDAVGDNLLADFSSVVDAVQCAVDVQKDLKEQNKDLSPNRKLKFRIGINVGDVIQDKGRIYGDAINIAARIESLSKAEGICISDGVFNQIENKLDLSYAFLGEQHVKNINKPVKVYRVLSYLDADIKLDECAQLEQEYRNQLKSRFTEDAAYYVPLSAETAEIINNSHGKSPRSAVRRRRRAKFEYNEWIPVGKDIKRIQLKTLQYAVEKYPCVILLGDPGCGKTTALENLAYQFSDNPNKLPIPLYLREFDSGLSLKDFITRGWGGLLDAGHWGAQELAVNLESYLEAGKLFFLFDALNEMPFEEYKSKIVQLRKFIDEKSALGNRFLVTCRLLDYGEELSGLQRVEILPLSDDNINEFLQNELPDDWEALWEILTYCGEDQCSLLEMARNPYLLTIMIDVFEEDQQLTQNRAELMKRFTQILLDWAKVKCPPNQWVDADVQVEALSMMAFEMQIRSGFGTKIKTERVKSVIPQNIQLDPNWPPLPSPPDQILSLAANAKIIEMPIDRSTVRFYHQLLQESFAAHQLLKKDPKDMKHLWRWPWLETEMPFWSRPESNYDPLPPPPPTGWEETTLIAAGSAPENDHQLICGVLNSNPVLAGLCLLQDPNRYDSVIRDAIIESLLSTIANPNIALRVRISAGDVLGDIGDPRLGEEICIQSGKFIMGEGQEQHNLFLPDYRITKFQVTNAEYKQFIADGGYKNKNYWTEAGWHLVGTKQNEPRFWQDTRFNKPNHPAIGLSWYECVAFCHWLSESNDTIYRLPSEAEWEKAARGTDGRTYPWGSKFDASRLNARAGEQIVYKSTPVGIYPAGASPFNLLDCAGNAWEWCSTRWKKPFPYDANQDEWQADYLEGENLRVLRSGSWNYKEDVIRCAYRFKFQPEGWSDLGGFRLVSPI